MDTATRLPAPILSIDHRTGSIAVGNAADLVLVDSDLSVFATLDGKLIYRKAEGSDCLSRGVDALVWNTPTVSYRAGAAAGAVFS